ncbi:hypothetical protein H7J87_11775 [Mycolicibacterium wolinskyi]|uniref:Uncharacterized protein n=1 Tax=Mycolicibacterium wolinskyi TaxID=59750 RepID=A0A1X2FJ75_9MYCO|nr:MULTISPECIES: hypothetical protein [Mycolicibacterium]MCV7286009.1 hypothetical protein [Mycolicibacterium wolinskyi]MCV7296205.1 hypothetical protein [Mycolicibacterium goodii]ORX18437.1 hypothetical protein AWC31_14130 [Mycolicibacterium wolinskyi]
MTTREYRGGAYAPPKTHKHIKRTRLAIATVVIALLAAAAVAVALFWHTPPPDHSGRGAEAVHRLLSAQVITASGTARTKDGVQHPFTVDINTRTGDALGTWASGTGTAVTYTVARRALFAQVNPGAWTALGIDATYQGWALVPAALLGETPIVFDPTALGEAVDAGPSSYAGSEYTYPGGTTVRLRDGDVESVTFKGSDFTLVVRNDETATKRIADSAREAAAARVATVNDTPAGFTVTLPAGVPEPAQEPPAPVPPTPTTSPVAAP